METKRLRVAVWCPVCGSGMVEDDQCRACGSNVQGHGLIPAQGEQLPPGVRRVGGRLLYSAAWL